MCVWMLRPVITENNWWTLLFWLWGEKDDKKNMLHIREKKKASMIRKKREGEWEEVIMLYVRCLSSASVESKKVRKKNSEKRKEREKEK